MDSVATRKETIEFKIGINEYKFEVGIVNYEYTKIYEEDKHLDWIQLVGVEPNRYNRAGDNRVESKIEFQLILDRDQLKDNVEELFGYYILEILNKTIKTLIMEDMIKQSERHTKETLEIRDKLIGVLESSINKQLGSAHKIRIYTNGCNSNRAHYKGFTIEGDKIIASYLWNTVGWDRHIGYGEDLDTIDYEYFRGR